MEDLSAFSAKPRLRLLLDHFARIKDTRQRWKVAYPLREVLFLVVCGTIASGDDYEDIVDWGKAHLCWLCRVPLRYPCADWLRCVMNRINPDLFTACFTSWVEESWPDKQRDHRHPGPGGASRPRGALVSTDAMGCNPTIAQSILDAKADHLLAVKDNHSRRSRRSRRCMPMSKAISQPRRPPRSTRSRRSTRTAAASRFATIPSPRWSIGMPRSAPTRVHRAFPNSPPSPWSRAGSSAATRSKPNGDPIFLPGRSRPQPSQSGPPSRREPLHQATPQARLVGSSIPAGDSRAAAMLTSTRCPGLAGRQRVVSSSPSWAP
jgi:DDE_Tnp_1-associated